MTDVLDDTAPVRRRYGQPDEELQAVYAGLLVQLAQAVEQADADILAALERRSRAVADLQAWIAAGAEAHLWRPDDIDHIIETLRRRST